jgi:Response regulator containing a CheY-like receiver domain and an HD-GYP domain
VTAESILCVDDDPQVRGLISRVLLDSGHDCVAVGSAEEARNVLDERFFAVVLCDIGLPGRSGLDLVEELGRTHPELATVMVTGRDDPEIASTALQLGAYGYLTKPFEVNQLLIDVTEALRRRKRDAARRVYESDLQETVVSRTAELEVAVARLEDSEGELRRAYSETISRLSRAIESHDGATGAHVERVSFYTEQIALALGLDPARAKLLRLVSPLHDIGKISVSEKALRKTGPLDKQERAEMERHADVGHELLAGSGTELLETAAVIAWTHHERWDGSGYPRGLVGEEIPLEGRIVAVADVFDALTSDRPYRPAVSAADARAHLRAGRGTAFDPQVVDAFVGDVRRARRNGLDEPVAPRPMSASIMTAR